MVVLSFVLFFLRPFVFFGALEQPSTLSRAAIELFFFPFHNKKNKKK